MTTRSSGPRGSNALVERGRARAKLGDVVRDGCKAEVGRRRGGGGAPESGLEGLKEGSRFISVRRWYKMCAPALAEREKRKRQIPGGAGGYRRRPTAAAGSRWGCSRRPR